MIDISELKAQMASVESEKSEVFDLMYDNWEQVLTEIVALRTENERMKGIIEKYGPIIKLLQAMKGGVE